jgi:hypothetical protein
MSCNIPSEFSKERGDVMKPLTLTAVAAMSVGLLGGCDLEPEAPAQPSLQSRFDKADANRDGVIEQREATSIANRPFSDVDTNDNQVVSFDEFEVALENPATPPRG